MLYYIFMHHYLGVHVYKELSLKFQDEKKDSGSQSDKNNKL